MFKIQLDVNDYWTGVFATVGELEDSVEVDKLPNMSEPIEKKRSYKYNRETLALEFDEDKYQSIISAPSTGNAPIDINSIISYRKVQMIKQSNDNLETFLNTAKMKSNVHGGEYQYYTVSESKQRELSAIIHCHSLAEMLGTTSVLKWNATGENCEDWTVQELATLALQIQAFVLPYVEMQRTMEVSIKNATTLEELNAIDITFSIITQEEITEEETNNEEVI